MQGPYKYICTDCIELQILTSSERASRFRPRCRFCGSLHLEPINKEMIAKRRDLHTVARRAAQNRLSVTPYKRKKK